MVNRFCSEPFSTRFLLLDFQLLHRLAQNTEYFLTSISSPDSLQMKSEVPYQLGQIQSCLSLSPFTSLSYFPYFYNYEKSNLACRAFFFFLSRLFTFYSRLEKYQYYSIRQLVFGISLHLTPLNSNVQNSFRLLPALDGPLGQEDHVYRFIQN